MTQINSRPLKTLIVKHKFSPVTNEIQPVEFSVSYVKLTIVFIIPNAKKGIPSPAIINAI